MTTKKANTTTTTTPATEATALPIQTKHLAVKFGMKATALRRVLRSMPEYADGVHTNYRWAENDPKIKTIELAIAKLAKDKEDRAAAAKAALESRKAKAEAQAKVDAQHAPAKA
jgi:hypothetical protein